MRGDSFAGDEAVEVEQDPGGTRQDRFFQRVRHGGGFGRGRLKAGPLPLRVLVQQVQLTRGGGSMKRQYKGAGQAMTDLVSGQVQVFLNNFLAGMPMIKAGKLRALAVTSSKRAAVAPELPTVGEAGLPDYVVTGWYGLYVPAATPATILNTLNSAAVRALRSKEVNERLSSEAAEIVASTPAQFADFQKAEIAKWAAVARKANLKAE